MLIYWGRGGASRAERRLCDFGYRGISHPLPARAPRPTAGSDFAPLAGLLSGRAVADVVDALEGGDDLLVVGDDDYGGVVLARHAVEDADDGQRALEAGVRIVVAACVVPPGPGVDTPADLERARAQVLREDANTGVQR